MKIILKPEAQKQVTSYVNLVKTEISGLAKSYIDADDNVVITEFKIFKQVCTSANTNVESKDIAKFIYELQKKGESVKQWDVWWHSHADMKVFWSGTDDKTIEDHLGGGPYLISLVTNKAGDYKARLDVFPTDTSPFGKKCFIKEDDISVEIERTEEQETEIEVKEELISKIEKEIEKAKEAIDELYKKELENANEQLSGLKQGTFSETIEQECQKEIDEKVSYPAPITYGNYYNGNHNYGYPKKKKKNKWQWWEKEYTVGEINNYPEQDSLFLKGSEHSIPERPLYDQETGMPIDPDELTEEEHIEAYGYPKNLIRKDH